MLSRGKFDIETTGFLDTGAKFAAGVICADGVP
jgi:hypothetical protein